MKSYAIACASIIAKVERDFKMLEYAKIYPQYGFDRHKGYGTKYHIEMIQNMGLVQYIEILLLKTLFKFWI